MTRRPLSVTQIGLAAALALALAGGFLVVHLVGGALAQAGVADEAARRVRITATLAVLAYGIVLVAAAAVGTRLLTAAMRTLRAGVLARARGESRLPAQHRVVELERAEDAVQLLAERVAERQAEVERGSLQVSVLLDAISDGIVQIDTRGRVIRVNPAARTLLGIGALSVGQPLALHVRSAEVRPLLERAAAGETIDAAEVVFGERTLLLSARPLAGVASGTTEGSVLGFVDLTEVRRLEQVRRDFVANVSHELKTPLTSIRGYSETLLANDLSPEMRRQFVEVVHRNANRLHDIVDDLLDLSRLESGGWRPELHDVDAAAITCDVWAGCSRRAQERGITFVPPEGPATVRADPGGLRQVLSNLLENAIRYTPDGGRVEVRVVPADAGIVLEVRDNGTGIPTDALSRIFERFYRVDIARSRAAGGTGLGLAIVKHLVEAMGGDVVAESELGRGTTIRVRLRAPA